MPESNTATPLPDPNTDESNDATTTTAASAGATGSSPDPGASAAAEPESPPASPGEFNKEIEAELVKATEICNAAKKPEYAASLAARGVDPSFIIALVASIAAAGQKSQTAVNCDHARKGATLSEAAAEQTLVASLQTIQSAARVAFLPDEPARLDNYLVGQRLADSRPLLERSSLAILDKANEERPAGLNTDFIVQVQGERATYVNANIPQLTEEARAKQDRATRDALVKNIIARRKKIQYAADTLWPPRKTESVQARTDFQLPQNRPYSY